MCSSTNIISNFLFGLKKEIFSFMSHYSTTKNMSARVIQKISSKMCRMHMIKILQKNWYFFLFFNFFDTKMGITFEWVRLDS